MHECGGHVKSIESTGKQENSLLFSPEKELNYESGNYLEISAFG